MEHIEQRLLYKRLQTTLQNASARAESSGKRLANIKWIVELPRAELAFQKKTKQLLITKTDEGEEMFIQYPGKESTRGEDKRRPWDFFPRMRKGNRFSADLDFQAIWDILFQALEPLKTESKELSSILATIFYRMAFMNDHVIDTKSLKTRVRYLSYDNAGQERAVEEKIELVNPWYRYSPNKEIINRISKIVTQWGDMSLEAFLHYNDLLAWNEDCKYFYRKQQARPSEWIRETGRVNTLLTHVSIIGYVSGGIRFSEVCVKFARGKGVAPATRDEIVRICGGYVTKG
ncbi:hypothetical protein ES703_43425 [subsurface metagenome]